MANEEVLGPRKTMFVLVIVVGCFAVLWPRILSPLILGNTRDQLKPNKFDREAGCCEVIFESEVAVLELLNEVCNSVVHVGGKLSPYAAAECRKTVNETCGVDIAAFLKRDENVGKTTKRLVDMMKTSNSSCLKEHFGVPEWTVNTHLALNSWTQKDRVKQERPPTRTGPHPALRERGRAIPPGAPAPARAVTMPPHARVRSSPLSVYYEQEIKPPPIPGMRPPLGSPGGPVPAPKSSMGFVMPIYTICIIVFFVYTLSKILFKRTGSSPYEPVSPDPQFRRRVFRDDSRTTPDKLVVTAISGLVAEVQQQMEASYAQNQQRQELQDNHARPYTNGTVLHNSGPVHIVASEYREEPKTTLEAKEPISEPKESTPEPKESTPEPKESNPEPKQSSPEPKESSPEPKEPSPELREPSPEESSPEPRESTPEDLPESDEIEKESSPEAKDTEKEETPSKIIKAEKDNVGHKSNGDIINLSENIIQGKQDDSKKANEEFLNDARENIKVDNESFNKEKRTTPDLLEEALKEDSPENEADDSEEEEDNEKSSVKVMGMEMTAHTADGGVWSAPPPPTAPAPRAVRPYCTVHITQTLYDDTSS